MNKIILIGNLANDPEGRDTKAGIKNCSFRIAVARRYPNQQTGEREADFFTVICWRATAENVLKFLRKGNKCAVEGYLQTRSYDGNDAVRHYVTEVIAENVEFLTPRMAQEPHESYGGY